MAYIALILVCPLVPLAMYALYAAFQQTRAVSALENDYQLIIADRDRRTRIPIGPSPWSDTVEVEDCSASADEGPPAPHSGVYHFRIRD